MMTVVVGSDVPDAATLRRVAALAQSARAAHS